jgi:uncharacterized protein (TIGR03435 family)
MMKRYIRRWGRPGATLLAAVTTVALPILTELTPIGWAQTTSQAAAQSPSEALRRVMASVPPTEFEVGEVKPCKPVLPQCRTLHELLSMSWAINKDMISGEPGWVKSDFFEVVAKMPAGSGRPNESLEAAEHYAQMLRRLLIKRFKIAYHLEDKMVPIYALEVARQPSKLRESEGPRDDQYKTCKNLTESPGVRTYECHHVPMEMLASWLPHQAADYLDRPVLDFTNLKGAYDIHLRWATRRVTDGIANGIALPGADASDTLTIFQALRDQLGLTLTQRQHPLPSVVIDQIEKLP